MNNTKELIQLFQSFMKSHEKMRDDLIKANKMYGLDFQSLEEGTTLKDAVVREETAIDNYKRLIGKLERI